MIAEVIVGSMLVGAALAWGVAILLTVHQLNKAGPAERALDTPSPSASVVISRAWNVEREECGASIVIARPRSDRGNALVCLAALTNGGASCGHSRCRVFSQGH